MKIKYFIIALLTLYAFCEVRSQKKDTISTEVIDVLGEKNSYIQDSTSLVFRSSLSNMQTPQQVQAVTQALIESQAITSYKNAVKNFSGVIRNTPYQRYTFRGFVSYNNFIVDGVSTTTYASFNQQPSLFNIASIDNIKGPASALFGENQPGGVVNFNLKRPLFYKHYEADLFYGTWNTFGGMLDYNNLINKNIAYRIVGGYEQTQSYRKPLDGENVIVTPSISFKLSKTSNLKADFTYQYSKDGYGYDRGIIGVKNSDGSYNTDLLPLSWTATSEGDHTTTDGFSGGLEFKSDFSNMVSFVSLARYGHVYANNNGHEQFYGYPVYGTPDSVKRYYSIYQLGENELDLVNYANFKFNTGKVSHILMPGVDLRFYNADNNYLEDDNVPSISLINPDFSIANPSLDTSYYENSDYKSFSYSFYIQELMSIGKQVQLSASLRYQNYNYTNEPGLNVPQNAIVTADSSDADALLPRFGLVYMPFKDVSFYGNYATSFVPQYSNLRLNGGPFEPEYGKQFEIGTKINLNKEKLFATISAFQITKDNLLFSDPNDTTGLTLIPTGEARSRGIEASISGEIYKSFNIVLNYAYTDAEFTKTSNAGEEGTPLPAAPKNIASLWLTYSTFLKKDNQLSVSGGCHYVDNRLAINNRTYTVPSYFVTDFAVSYKFRNFGVDVNFNNIFDNRYFYGAQNPARLFPGDPFNMRVGINYGLN